MSTFINFLHFSPYILVLKAYLGKVGVFPVIFTATFLIHKSIYTCVYSKARDINSVTSEKECEEVNGLFICWVCKRRPYLSQARGGLFC